MAEGNYYFDDKSFSLKWNGNTKKITKSRIKRFIFLNGDWVNFLSRWRSNAFIRSNFKSEKNYFKTPSTKENKNQNPKTMPSLLKVYRDIKGVIQFIFTLFFSRILYVSIDSNAADMGPITDYRKVSQSCKTSFQNFLRIILSCDKKTFIFISSI